MCGRFIIDEYPRRRGITTYFVESSKSHAGWEFARSGRNMGQAVSDGFLFRRHGMPGDEGEWIPGRDDMQYLGFDEQNVWVGPEHKTKITLHHPDGGTAYAHSYQPQKWVESLAGGSKPHLAILGHYHKSNKFRPRDVHVICPGCLCWQTPFMRRKRIAAEVAAWLVELDVDSGGSIKRLRTEEVPFFPPTPEKRFLIGAPGGQQDKRSVHART